jgi:hypothetical protein
VYLDAAILMALIRPSKRLTISSGALSVRTQVGIVILALASYWLGLALFPPAALGINDEVFYVHQAEAFARGQVAETLRDPLSGQSRRVVPSTYPVGTSLLRAPFVRLGGWQAAPLASAVTLTAAVLLLAHWIALGGGPPLAAPRPRLPADARPRTNGDE